MKAQESDYKLAYLAVSLDLNFPAIDKNMTLPRLVESFLAEGDHLRDVACYLGMAGFANWGTEVGELYNPL